MDKTEVMMGFTRWFADTYGAHEHRSGYIDEILEAADQLLETDTAFYAEAGYSRLLSHAEILARI